MNNTIQYATTTLNAATAAEMPLPPQHPVEIPADDKGSKLGSSKSDEYLQKVADQILEQVKNNQAAWQQPFEAGTVSSVMPISGGSGEPYRGLNTINLMAVASAKGYDDNRWYTYKNAKAAGGQVRRGEEGTQIHFWKIPTKDDFDKERAQAIVEGREPRQLFPMMRIYTVFNAEQIDGLPERQLNKKLLTEFERHEKAESILENSGVDIEHIPEKTGYYSAYYTKSTDTITLPQRELFISEDAYYATALHELAHATGHPSRLNRDLSGKFGSYSYAKEELRAEMASMMIGQELQIGHDPTNHYAYMKNWAAIIENDPKEFFRAAKDADLITNYVLNLDKTKEKVAEVEQRQEVKEKTDIEKTSPKIDQNTPYSIHEVAKLNKPLEDKVLMLAERSDIADKIQSVDRQQLLSFVRGIKSAMDFNEHGRKQLLELATYSNKKFDAREFAFRAGMIGDRNVVAYAESLQGLAESGILKSLDGGWKYELTDEAAYLIQQTYNVVEAENFIHQDTHEKASEFGQSQSDFEKEQKQASQSIQETPTAKELQANITTENRRLFVPYEQKDVASSLGARWDKNNKTWYAPAGSDLDKFKPWLKEPVREFVRPEDEFARQLEAHGLQLESGHPIMDGQWHRLKVDGDRTGKSGAYIGHIDGIPRGTVKNFKTGVETNWTAKDAAVKSVPSSLDIERAKAAAEAKQKASYNQAADAAKLVLNHAQPAHNHPYLDKKGVAAHGLYVVPDKLAVNLDNTNLAIANDWREAKAMREEFKTNGIEKQVLTKGDLIVPAINEHGDVRTFQTISGNNGSFKSFVKGGEKSGSYHVIGDLDNTKDVIIAEGYATAATLHEQTGKAVVVAFDAGNLSAVAEKMRKALPDARIYIAADNDRNNSVNTGIEKANAAAKKADGKVIFPQFDKLDGAEKLSDWNDLHKANPHDFATQIATSEMGRQDFADKLVNLPPERQEVFKGWYDYINDKLASLPEARNAKQASLEQEVLKAEQGLSNLPSVTDYQAQQAAKKQAEQVVTQQPTVAIQAPTVDTTNGKGFDR